MFIASAHSPPAMFIRRNSCPLATVPRLDGEPYLVRALEDQRAAAGGLAHAGRNPSMTGIDQDRRLEAN
jgi:hypothetical protein